MKNILTSIVVAVVVVALALWVLPKSNAPQFSLSGSVSPTHTEHQVFRAGFTTGGETIATTSTATAYTLTKAELRDGVSYISWLPNINTTLTTMASSSAPLVGLRVGESKQVYIYNASTTAASTITLAAGTGVDLQEDEGATVIVNGLEVARLTFLKKSDSDVIAWLEVAQIGD